MKTINFLKITLFSLFALTIVSCNNSDEFDNGANEPLAVLKVAQEDGVSSFVTPNICPVLNVTDPLTADEIEFLFAMREDEKMAKDLYTAFGAQYPTAVQFSRIATAEATHVAAIETMLTYYEVSFPALTPAGVFADAEKQAQYDAFLAQGTTIQGAFEVMALLEEENIAAYKAVEATATNANIKLILANMVRASSNHLKAAVRQLTILGITYTPTHLDQATFDEVISSAFAQGNMYGQQMGKGNRGGNTNSQKGNMGQGNKGNVNGSGICTGTNNGSSPGMNGGQGQAGKGYRGGR